MRDLTKMKLLLLSLGKKKNNLFLNGKQKFSGNTNVTVEKQVDVKKIYQPQCSSPPSIPAIWELDILPLETTVNLSDMY